MMFLRRSAAGLLLVALFLPHALHAAVESPQASQDICNEQTASLLAREQRLFRAVILGVPEAAQASEGDVRFDAENRLWTKKGGSWIALDPALAPLSSAAMDAALERDAFCVGDEAQSPTSGCVTLPRKGLVGARSALASESFVPAAVQAMRALMYRTRTVCALMLASIKATDGAPMTVNVPGGKPLTAAPLQGCRFQGTQPWQEATVAVTKQCDRMAQAIVDREMQLLLMLAAYDSGVRSLLQFSGTFDDVLARWNGDLLTPLWQTLRVIRQLPSLPCFLSQCDG